MGGVCSIDLQCTGVILSKCAQLGHGQECHERTFGHKGHQRALVSLDLECQAHDALPFALSLLLVVSCRQSGSFHSSQSQSMTEGQAEVMIEGARSG